MSGEDIETTSADEAIEKSGILVAYHKNRKGKSMQKNTKERVKEITDDLEKGTREVFESDRYGCFLS